MRLVSLIIVLFLCGLSLLSPQGLTDFCSTLRAQFISEYGFVLTWSALGLMVILLGLAISPLGKIKLGNQLAFSNFAYWSMICACGIGVAPIFWSVIEPVNHAKEGLNLADNMAWTFHNWMLGAGTYYGAFGLAFAYLSDRKIGNILSNKWLRIGLAVVTIISLALTFLYVIETFRYNLYIITALIVALTIISTKYKLIGIKVVSYITIIGSLLLIGFVQFSVGNTYLPEYLQLWVNYLLNEGQMMVQTEPKQWLAQWTYNYYAAWLGWSVFLGLFLARISQGRSIRQIVVGALIVPPILASLWFTVFGLSALELGTTDTYSLLSELPYSSLSIGLVLFLSILFFIVQYDSASIIIEDLTEKGRVFYILLIAALTVCLAKLPESVELLRDLTTLVSAPILLLVLYLFGLFLWRLYDRTFLSRI